MKVIGERIIEYLKADSALIALLGSARSIFSKSLNESDNRPSKYVVVEASLGEDLNYAYGQEDEIDIEIGVSRKIPNSYTAIMTVMESVDDLLNKQESNLANGSWKIIHFVRTDVPTRGVLIDDSTNEYYVILRYKYILDESS